MKANSRDIGVQQLCDSIVEDWRILGATDRHVSIAAPIDQAGPDAVTYCSSSTEDGLLMIRQSKAGVIVCSSELSYEQDDYKDRTLVLVARPRLAFIRVMQRHFAEEIRFGISPGVVIDEEAHMHPSVCIGPNCYIGECEIGENTVIHGNVYVYPNVKIGRNVLIEAGAVIGAGGQGFERNQRGEFEKFPQVGGVVIEDDVEIGSNASVMRGALGNTVIGTGTKVGHLCNIGHGVVIGRHCLIVSMSMIGGSTVIGDYSQISFGACVRDGIKVGNNAFVGMGAVVTKNIDDNCVVYGVPARAVRARRPNAANGKQDEVE